MRYSYDFYLIFVNLKNLHFSIFLFILKNCFHCFVNYFD
jgi:hypothetical protein